ncbi:peptide/nickel transport system ATP-binding protein [Alicyclobacillus hesperidum]|uniref:Peptide/nickel transport system ATP-binding protein n=1 Tax=Alicyclobacillus hesperidum TaxID=89784 RepID=A0A1H2R474_9BACL|nr:ABC transporter ATP-binding protein [Alicyclobacillus hesperidum]SDW14236.1 peptide/nickel transport system ATP-binding protein [Alicyclobacillus hesperidum]
MAEALLAIDDLRVQFDRGEDEVFAVNGVSFSIAEGEALGIVGESGSGKSVTLMSALGLIRENGKIMAGTAKFQGHDLLKMRPRQLEDIRGRDIGVIFQDPMTSLNPVMRIGDQIMESMLTHQYAGRREAFERTLQLLHEMGIPEPKARFRNYPHEFSGGMRQRIMIAIALACEPQLLIADEPTTALDVTVQMQILALLQEQRRKKQMSIAMITHDFGVATNFCDRIIVLYAGQIMEMADTRQFLLQPAHPYTMGLKNSIIEIGQRDRQLSPIPGMAPTLTEPPKSCSFASRCPFATERCRSELPALREISPNHHVACHRAEEVLAHAI